MASQAHWPLRTLQRAEHSHSAITAYIQDCFRRQIFCDLRLRAGSDPAWSIHCHRCVLGAVFPPLQALLASPDDRTVDLILAEFAPQEIAPLIDSIYAHLSQKSYVIPASSMALAQLLSRPTRLGPPPPPAVIDRTTPHPTDWAQADVLPELDGCQPAEAGAAGQDHDALLDCVKLERWSPASESETVDVSPAPRRGRRRVAARSGPILRSKGQRKRLASKKVNPATPKLSPVYPKPINHLDYYNADKLAARKRSMACDCPGLTFGNLMEQQNHFYTAHCQRDFSVCETCGNPVRIKYMEAHRETCAGSQRKPCLCPHCGHHTKGSGTLSTHMFDNHMKVKCKICGQEFVGDKSRRKHDHEQHAQTFDCDHCPLQFNTLYKKRSHMVRVHVPDHLRPYVCSECGQGFLYEGKLKRHKMNKHIRARPFACRCGCDNVAYNDQSTRNQHENRSHPHHPIVLERLKNPTVKHKPGVRKDPMTESEIWTDPP
ncbi:hypothetical protein TCAL_08102 [Tigriopus californicus]|uniref:BTB domain-containing protein n=1 Tax=Tigriopus californicus TaxID=6832 RepID=A0A553PQ22_TIGCA|nr:hypothetical protein TCAL_08102 [Tigriopus californicus]|eukprot:TCALIF_08102-PA protein Name:"Similar to Zinc finger protein ZFMSA12A (Micropterus salmoides)" AED:0.13 eAED:0.15 QI:0/-1/0/1/-1/1/1/0/487